MDFFLETMLTGASPEMEEAKIDIDGDGVADLFFENWADSASNAIGAEEVYTFFWWK